jgi:integrase
MPTKKMSKPNPWPPRSLGHGGGTWVWEVQRSQPLGLKFALEGKRTTVWGRSVPDCIEKRDAKRAEAAEAAEIRARLANGQGTVRQMMEGWFNYHAGNRAPATQDTYRRSMEFVGSLPLADRVAREVSRGDVQNVLLYAVDELDRGHSSCHKIRNHLNMAFDYGLDQGYVLINPCTKIKLPGHVRRPQKPVYFGEESFGTLRQYLVENPSQGNVAVLTALLTGMRTGELMGLCWDAIDWDAARLEVRRAMQRSQGGRVLTLVEVLKTESSHRIVELRPDLVAALHRLRAEQRRERMAAPVWRGGDHVFTREDGRPFAVGTLAWHNERACKAAGIPVVSPHKLRHTHLSILLDRGVVPALVAAHAGHKNTRMLTMTYEHAMHPEVSTAVLG